MANREKWLQKTGIVCLLALFSCALWGSAFPFIKIGYKLLHIPVEAAGSQVLFAGYRFTLAGIIAIFLGSVAEKKLLLPRKSALGKIVKLCMLQTVLQYLFFYMGLAHTSGVKAAIIEGANGLLAILVASILFRQEKLTLIKTLGCLVGFVGVVIANMGGGGIEFTFSFLGEGFMLLSVLSYAFSSVYLKIYSKDENPVMLSGYQFFVGGLILVACGLAMGGTISGFSPVSLTLLVYLAFLSSAAYSVWGILLKYNPVSKVTVYGFMIPVIGVFLSAFMLQESAEAFSIRNIVALIFVSVGIYAVNRTKTTRSS